MFDYDKTKAQKRFIEGRNKSNDERRERLQNILDHYNRENELYRRPCSCCGNLVKPELIDQHFRAYHRDFKGIPSVVEDRKEAA